MSAPAESRENSMTMNMVTTVMAFSVSAFFVLFVFTRLLCARIHLRAAAAEHAARAGDAALPAFHVELGIRGLEPAVVTSFPTVKFGDGSHRPPAQEESQCTVCLEEYEAKDVVRVLPSCGHAFHVACIDAWLKQHSTCPVCRASLRANGKHRAAAAMPPVYCAAVRAPPSTSSSDRDAFQAEAAAADHMDMTASRMEIISDEPEQHSTARQSLQGNASERIASADTCL